MAQAYADGLRRLMAQREKLVSELEAYRNQISGLDLAIQLLSDTPMMESAALLNSGHKRQLGVTETLLELLREVGTAGLNAQLAAKIALERGVNLKRQSASSLLSRLKKEGTVVYEDGRYKLIEFSREAERLDEGAAQERRAA